MRFLLDTNIVIAAEPATAKDVELATEIVIEFLKLAHAGGHQLQIHPETVAEMGGDGDTTRRELHLTLAQKYPLLPNPPLANPALFEKLGLDEPGEHTVVDLTILAALQAECADYFVTNDQRLRKRARRLELGERVVSAADATAILRALFPTVSEPPPLVRDCYAHQLDNTHRIFQSLRVGYQDFDKWLAKCKREQRQCWVITQRSDTAALAIVNEETRQSYGLPGRVLKICTFKVAPNHRGFRFGELLLKTVFEYAFGNGFQSVFVEIFPEHGELIDLLETFGFDDTGQQSDKGELVVAKALVPSDECRTMPPLEFHRRFGPNNFCLEEAPAFIVPVQPRFHDLLFPAQRPQLSLIEQSNPFGNGIRKAYLCHASTKKIQEGSVLLFYRSHDECSVSVVGVAEGTLRSEDADQIARFVGKRTVYARSTIAEMARRTVLAITFRHARTLNDPWPLPLLKSSGILKGPPQSINQVPTAGIPWIKAKFSE